MPAIPLPFIIALLLAVLLLKLVLLRQTALRPAIGFVAACMVVAFAVGARWSFDAPFVRFLQPVLAAALPPIAWLCFTAGHTERGRARWLYLLPVALALLLSATWQVWRSPVDLLLALLYVGYGLALLRLARAGPDGFAAARLSDTARAENAARMAGGTLVVSALVDLLIAVDFGLYSGDHAALIVAAGNILLLPVLAYAVATIGRSLPADAAGETAPADLPRAPTEDDSRIVEAIDRLMREKELFRDPDLTLNRIARRAGLPPRQISGAVNRRENRNVSQLVNGYRIEAAKRLLAETDLPVTAVMFEAGFQTKSNFNREFLKATGRCPSDYRRAPTAG
ncbi:AraC family transcriptional regulator [Shinella yambaruensis]|uniref:AraC family transcriptional regulator n=1 Tax=Shinella yambaruensis TaxID=415996 RepID=A0ABQ5ZGN3_9HYPH|nr:AraC family transcriptional regulator [Shinella yambaruensis]MCJ8023974.1 AraC family transcriptional regulator [Shinella yambaruensis]MCU7978876.1 AraC family transcriptional regulator [Shinella yambaruensis]GLR51985.1 AraC family transcriptional regulator [Shinella yambaruensis]